jgi:membrane-bound lytic murein transglycosylase MltF
MNPRFKGPVSGCLLAVSLAMLCGCSGGKADKNAPAPPHEEAAAQAPEPALDGAMPEAMLGLIRKPFKADFDDLVKRRCIRVLTTYSKTNYFLDGAAQRGLTYEAVSAFDTEINKKLKTTPQTSVTVVIMPVARDQLLTGLVEGLGDIAAAELTVTPEREKLVDFSIPAATGVREVPVVGPGVAPPKSPEELSGREVSVRGSSSYFESLTLLNQKLKAAGKPPVTIRAADENLEDEDLLEMVSAGILPMVVVDEHKATFWSDVLPGLTACPSAAVRTGGSLAWAFRKGSPKLKQEINAFAQSHKMGTTFGNILLARYLKDNEWVKNPAAAAEMARFKQSIGYFKKYGQQYDFDYLLLAAQGYQESQLNQDKKSPRGAVGIMQVMPKTAAAPPILIPDVDKADRNVQAGVKYLRHINDTYFKDAKMDRINCGLFCFAAYNAGPARIAGLRKKAQASGLNPDVWFGNVEIVAAREIGRETVTYVRNIYKYYVAYKLIVEQAQQKQAAKASAKKTR